MVISLPQFFPLPALGLWVGLVLQEPHSYFITVSTSTWQQLTGNRVEAGGAEYTEREVYLYHQHQHGLFFSLASRDGPRDRHGDFYFCVSHFCLGLLNSDLKNPVTCTHRTTFLRRILAYLEVASWSSASASASALDLLSSRVHEHEVDVTTVFILNSTASPTLARQTMYFSAP